jgi:hypothetical protein
VTIRHALDHGFTEVEVTKQAQDAWIDLLLSGPGMLLGSPWRRSGAFEGLEFR